jgi:inorganic phosphate transporter, PiT family
MDTHLLLIVGIVLAALAFDFINGFHDAANSIATIVSTRVLSPAKAVVWAAFFNFVAFGISEMKVAGTIGKGIIDPGAVDLAVIIGALGGAIVWNLLTWWWGLPSSSSHALVGGLVGAGLMKGGPAILGWSKIGTTAAFILISPLMGMVMGGAIMIGLTWLLRRQTPGKVDKWFRRLQLVSAGAYSLGHGSNDAQKTIGIIVVLLYSQGYLGTHFPQAHEIPFWIVVGCYGAMGLGTMMGGWRIVKTMGSRLTKLVPFGGFCAETSGAITLGLTSFLGIPVSTTHTITGAIVGVGSVTRVRGVRWGVAGRIVWAWIFTIPASALIAAIGYALARLAGV